jgi:hypothetical protein
MKTRSYDCRSFDLCKGRHGMSMVLHMGSTFEELGWLAGLAGQIWEASNLSPCFRHMRSIHTRIPVFSLLCLIQESLACS